MQDALRNCGDLREPVVSVRRRENSFLISLHASVVQLSRALGTRAP